MIKLLLYLILWELQVSLTSSEATNYLLMKNNSSSLPWDKDPCFENRWCCFLCQAFCTSLSIKLARQDRKTRSQIIHVSCDVCTVHAEPPFTLRNFYAVKEWNTHMTGNQALCDFSSSWFVFNSVSILFLDTFYLNHFWKITAIALLCPQYRWCWCLNLVERKHYCFDFTYFWHPFWIPPVT